MESLNMKPKNDSMSNIETTSLLAVSSELFSLINIITLPDEANYSYQKFLNVLLHAATSSTNSLAVSYTHLRAHETPEHLVCRLLLEKKKKQTPLTPAPQNQTHTSTTKHPRQNT